MRFYPVLIALLMISGPATASVPDQGTAQPETQAVPRACINFGLRAGQVMAARQAGEPFQQIISEDARRYPSAASKAVADMLMQALNAPIEETDAARQQRVQEFATYYLSRCSQWAQNR
ncbi:hypothetical protein NK553_27170 [Pseudomonas sp. ZM23]|uniref:Uncharacterized protein n=1 Tax=Pseudomonas triclosanedens TaxID=2961893 RepID=A0ABY6ZTA5_9PSED|nr:hypothetical protein [Pseudomonas triclosanedens]MCP8467640.1 hypothetical protein [Pseudomonas triclosanedens]MCP8473386.1 hypothetical protein [Pseudomonas triclosanedens]MCP8479415.1 hypothetical protein [Pseudomonas triclosanedens]WAI47109.1 hypothetical protein OU419_15100 [Pseudomonas triclosanedens]